ncbi:MAG: DUF5110 domain-containing protein, partial [Phycisphaerales bacterium]
IALDDKGQATGTLYEDAGEGFGYRKGEFALTTYEAKVQGDGVVVKVAKREGSMQLPKRTVKVALLVEGPNGTTRTVSSSFAEDASVTIKP